MIRCIAIDDEPLALTQISAYIIQVPYLELVESCRDAFSAIEILSREKIDLIFVDINMPDLNGLDFVRSLPIKPIIIFTTAYSEYALEGFRVDALDYLLKPFGYQEFLHSTNKALHQYDLIQGNHKQAESIIDNEYVFVNADYKNIKVKISDITYIESQREYIKIFSATELPVMTQISLKSIEEQLPQQQFMRVHRSFIVNLNRVKEVSRAGIMFGTNVAIPIGEQYRDKFNDFIGKRTLLKRGT